MSKFIRCYTVKIVYLQHGSVYYCRLNDVTIIPCIVLGVKITDGAAQLVISMERNVAQQLKRMHATAVNILLG